jgi:3-oxoacyl-[acyl-carrier-protein] synthase II
MKRRVVITGMGWITPLGTEIEAVWKRLLAGDSGINRTSIFDAATFPTTFSAEVQNFDVRDFLGDRYADHANCSRNTGFALAAAELAWQAAHLNGAAGVDPEMVGVYLGAGEGPIDFDNFVHTALAGWNAEQNELDAVAWAREAYQNLDAVREFEQDPNCAAGHIAYRFNAQGPNLNTLTACAASTQALGEAARLISRGDADIMISGGAHSMIHPLGVTGFNLLTALSNRNDDYQSASRPFDATRDGFVLGEGAGILVLEEYDAAHRRGAPLLAEIIGYGSTADAFRVTDMHETGAGAANAMRAAMRNAGVTPADINYISAHGTGTGENDKIESRAIGVVFGDNPPPISSVKSMLGHLIAGAGAVELITCVLAIRDSMIPPTMHYRTPDSNCPFDYVPNQPRAATLQTVLSNSFGFGGQNDTIVIRKVD